MTRNSDDWGGAAVLNAVFTQIGAFGLQATSRDSAMLQLLQPGSYTAQVRGVGDTSGVALVEVYDVP
jgi:hypothetical protein